VEHLFKVWAEFAADVKTAPHVLLLADYDGTLSRIVGRPEDAVLSPGVRRTLRVLAGKPAYSTGVISGRGLAQLKSMVGIEGIYYSGNHGLEIEGPGLKYIHPQAASARATIEDLAAQLAKEPGNIEGVIIQEKGLSVSVHYRLAKPGNEDAITRAVSRITAPHVDKGEIRVYPMKKVWEIRPPVDWDKGKAAEFIGNKIKASLGLSRLLTIYLGDDTTDEDAFKVVHRPGGWGIYVGPGTAASAAGYYLNSTEEVEAFLTRLAALK
jgi:trehalose 6-phosphate phosphatase